MMTVFDTQKIREYAERAKKEWGETTEYQEFETKNARRTQKESGSINEQLMGLVAAEAAAAASSPLRWWSCWCLLPWEGEGIFH